MSQQERTGRRNLAYSSWHRPNRIRRYLSARDAFLCAMVDIDSCECCPWCYEPVALIETAQSAESPKAARATANLANMAGISAYSVSYVHDPNTIPPTCDACGHDVGNPADIRSMRAQQIAPVVGPVIDYTPAEYARWLLSLRASHSCDSRKGDRF